MEKFVLEKPIGGDLDHVTTMPYGDIYPWVTNRPMGFNIDPCPNNT